MIPKDFIEEWRENAPWIASSQVEQDLIISRALVDLFSSELLSQKLAFRGGTALYKLYSTSSARYSEDIDLVQIEAEPIGTVANTIRKQLDPWLGTPQWKNGRGCFTLYYRYQAEGPQATRMKLKIEINTREHFSVRRFSQQPFSIDSSWFSGEVPIHTYSFEELIGTKLRALYQRKKGRDLFDCWYAFTYHDLSELDVVDIFHHYLEQEGAKVTRALFEQNFLNKVDSPAFLDDIPQLLSSEYSKKWKVEEAQDIVLNQLCPLLKGESWKGNSK